MIIHGVPKNNISIRTCKNTSRIGYSKFQKYSKELQVFLFFVGIESKILYLRGIKQKIQSVRNRWLKDEPFYPQRINLRAKINKHPVILFTARKNLNSRKFRINLASSSPGCNTRSPEFPSSNPHTPYQTRKASCPSAYAFLWKKCIHAKFKFQY